MVGLDEEKSTSTGKGHPCEENEKRGERQFVHGLTISIPQWEVCLHRNNPEQSEGDLDKEFREPRDATGEIW